MHRPYTIASVTGRCMVSPYMSHKCQNLSIQHTLAITALIVSTYHAGFLLTTSSTGSWAGMLPSFTVIWGLRYQST